MPEENIQEDFTEDTSTVDNEETEKQARKMGWKPESEWKGDPPPRGFVDAEEFLRVNDSVLPVVSAENRRLKEEVDRQGQEIAALKDGNARFKVFTDKALTRERAEKEDALRQLEGRRVEAINNSEGEAVVETEREIRAIEKELDAIPQQARDPAIDSWLAENQWYTADPEARAVTEGLSMALRNERPDLDGRAHLDELRVRVAKAIPHKFKNPRREEGSVEGARRTPRSTTAHTFENLPADAKREFAEFKLSIPGFTPEEYVEQYDWED